MIILRQKTFSKKEDDKKKDKVATGASVLSGAGSVAAGIGSKKLKDKANAIGFIYKDIMPLSEKLENSPELEKRYIRRVDRAIQKSEKAANKLGKAGIALGAASLGSAAYAIKKSKDAKKKEDKK